jgi:uncharacterized membrane protein
MNDGDINGSAPPDAASRRPLRKRNFAFLRHELDYWRREDLISEGQALAIGALYEPSKGYMSQVLLALGAMLVGLGFLSYIAANWMDFSRVFRVGLILTAYVAAILSAWRADLPLPKTSRALLLLGSFIYGGGIFLIAQIFHEGGHYTTALFWWMLGIIPVALIFRDRLQLVLLQLVAIVYINGVYRPWYSTFLNLREGFPWAFLSQIVRPPEPLLLILALWALWWFIDNRWSPGFNINFFVTLNLLGIHFLRFYADAIILLVCGAVGGLLVCLCAFGRWKWTLGGWGVVLLGFCGILLTFPDVWRGSKILRFHVFQQLEDWMIKTLEVRPEVGFTVGAALFVCVAMIWLMHREFTLAVPFFCLLILRYYFDRFYDFMPKAMFFTVGGIILIAMGFWLERVRRRVKWKERQEKRGNGGRL